MIKTLKKISAINLIVIVVLVLSLRGLLGVPKADELLSAEWKENGPFELSPERGRFALAYNIVEEASVYYKVDIARFVTPDLGYKNGEFVSLFAPGVSFIILPGYVLGKALGASQVGAYAAISLFAFLNYLLIINISKLLGAKKMAGTLAGLIFLFATPAYAYAVNLYQHHISTFLILSGIYLAVRYKGKWVSLFAIVFLCALGIVVDNPNLFLMFPLGLYVLLQLFSIKQTKTLLKIKFRPLYIFTALGAVVPIALFLAFNQASYGNPFQLSGTVSSVVALDENGYPTLPDNIKEDPELLQLAQNPESQKKSSVGFFSPRAIVNGLYIHTLSLDRGMLIYTPVIIFGLLGAFKLYKKENQFLGLLAGIATANLILYSMWGDPWGGWAFGSRYMIPTYAIFAIFISAYLSEFPKSRVMRLIFRVILVYSISVNTLGAITTSALPPKVQASQLGEISGKVERYTYRRNWEYLRDAGSKTFVYREYASKTMSARQYYFVLVAIILLVSLAAFRVVYPIKSKK